VYKKVRYSYPEYPLYPAGGVAIGGYVILSIAIDELGHGNQPAPGEWPLEGLGKWPGKSLPRWITDLAGVKIATWRKTAALALGAVVDRCTSAARDRRRGGPSWPRQSCPEMSTTAGLGEGSRSHPRHARRRELWPPHLGATTPGGTRCHGREPCCATAQLPCQGATLPLPQPLARPITLESRQSCVWAVMGKKTDSVTRERK